MEGLIGKCYWKIVTTYSCGNNNIGLATMGWRESSQWTYWSIYNQDKEGDMKIDSI